MSFAFSPLGLVAAALVVAILAFGLYKRIGVIGSFQRAELTRGARFAKARVTTAGASVLLLVVIGVAAAAGASVRAVYALLFFEAACVVVYLLLTGTAGFLEGRGGRDQDHQR